MAKVIIKFKEMVRGHVTLNQGTTTIGRTSTNDIPVENLAISRRHAEIVREQGRFLLRDLHSSNGTFVNGVRVTEKELHNGDAILIGKHTLLFVEQDELEQAIAAAPKVGQDPDTFLRSTMEWEIPSGDTGAATLFYTPHPITQPASLWVRSGALARTHYLLSSEATLIGAAAYADVRLTDANAPAVAAVIRHRGSGYDISPSEPGVLLNKRKLIRPQPLEPGSLIIVQGVVLEFRTGEEAV